jgi:hypothetical protein
MYSYGVTEINESDEYPLGERKQCKDVGEKFPRLH